MGFILTTRVWRFFFSDKENREYSSESVSARKIWRIFPLTMNVYFVCMINPSVWVAHITHVWPSVRGNQVLQTQPGCPWTQRQFVATSPFFKQVSVFVPFHGRTRVSVGRTVQQNRVSNGYCKKVAPHLALRYRKSWSSCEAQNSHSIWALNFSTTARKPPLTNTFQVRV